MSYVDLVLLREIEESSIIIESLVNKYAEIKRLFKEILANSVPNCTIYTGCGSSYYAALKGIDPLIYGLNGVKILAMPGSEVLFLLKTSKSYLRNCLLLLFSRSGETGEITSIIDHVKQSSSKTIFKTIGFTCNEESYLVRNADYSIISKECCEKGYYMTKSFIA